MVDLWLSQRGTSVSARWLLAQGVAVAGAAEEVCRGLELGTLPPAMPRYRTAGPYANRDNCEVAGPLDILRPPADAGRP